MFSVISILQLKIHADDSGHIVICYRRALIDRLEEYNEYIFGVSIRCDFIQLCIKQELYRIQISFKKLVSPLSSSKYKFVYLYLADDLKVERLLP
jgi:hypothetical protein